MDHDDERQRPESVEIKRQTESSREPEGHIEREREQAARPDWM